MSDDVVIKVNGEQLCLDPSPTGLYGCNLTSNHDCAHMAQSHMDGFIYATWPREVTRPPVKVDYDPRELNIVETMRVGELQVWMDRVVRDCDQEMACKLLYHYDLQRKRLDIIQATPPSRRTT